MAARKPKILILADKRGWAFDHSALSIQQELGDEFEFKIVYVAENPVEEAKAFDCDIIDVLWWGEDWHHVLNLPRERVIKEMASMRWVVDPSFGCPDNRAFADRYLADAGTVITTARRIQAMIQPFRPVLYVPKGIDAKILYPEGVKTGPLVVGWAGNINDPCKGIRDIVAPACEGDWQLVIAPGNIHSRDAMRAFYNQIDVFCIASTAEGQPLTLIESLACGCFPVTVDVGVVPEIVQHRDNGLIVDRSVAAFRAALTWCHSNLDWLRQRKTQRAADLRAVRSWQALAPYWRGAYRQALALAESSGKGAS